MNAAGTFIRNAHISIIKWHRPQQRWHQTTQQREASSYKRSHINVNLG
jgi:hypothetical protein